MHPQVIHSLHQSVAISYPTWLYIHSYVFANVTGLMIYRSPVVKPGHKMYDHVIDALGGGTYRMVVQQTIPDPEMMFREGQLEVYRDAVTSDMGYELMPVMEKLMTALVKVGGVAV